MLRKLLAKIKKHQMKRVALWQISSLSARELKDIGLSKSDIWKVLND